ncbi:MerR family transcriptional regulator [Enterococcus sp. BWR-S5]|uniref:MerR family transcriptional regulator n=1 Tax=Enterococcus sp. BWR-S5 TaxID=2787714 RepID=UPI0019216F4F|nr:GyrI-like domain-containing protein [Enterococcus sp. BWR-S5]MBL1226227.1 GyrI-like domain-containing protein [Enterococcus sp. BWR-S5]
MNIAQFSKISGVSVSTLHYYDKLGLFSPVEKHKLNGYRDYQLEQLDELNKIMILKDSGIKLEMIKDLLSKKTNTADLSLLLEENILLLEKEIIDRKKRIQRIHTNLFLLRNGGIPAMNEIIIKQVEAINTVSLRRSYRKNDLNQSFDEFCEQAWQELEQTIRSYNISLTTPCMTRYFEGLFINQDSPTIDLEIIEPILKPLQPAASASVQLQTLPAQKVVSAIHRGSLSEIEPVFNKMMLWLNKNKYTINGPVREIYHRVEAASSNEPDVPVTELQIPIAD